MRQPLPDRVRIVPTRRAARFAALVTFGFVASAASAAASARAAPVTGPAAPSQLAGHIYLPVSVRGASLDPGPTATPGAPSTPDPQPTAGPAARPLLNELLVQPSGAAPQFIELRARAGGTTRTADVRLEVIGGGSIVLPTSAPDVTAREVVLVLLDGRSGVEGREVHAGPAGFLPAAGELVLRDADGTVVDRVSWGRGIGDVPLGPGGLLTLPPPGSVLARLGEPPSSGAPGDVWLTLEPEEASPGRANPPSTVRIVLPPDGSMLSPGTVRLSWYPAPGADRYRVQVSADAGFGDRLLDEDAAEAEIVTKDLPAGRYFWRVAVIQDGQTLPYGESTRLLLAARPRRAARGRLPQASPAATPADDAGVILDVPYLSQHKDTGMLLLESPSSSGAHAWDVDHGQLDTSDKADNMNCALASIAMVVAFHGGDLSQDRIGFEHFRGRAEGPEEDLNYGDGFLVDEWASLAAWALGTNVVTERRIGEYGTAAELSLDDMWRTVVAEIDADRPVIVRVPGHAMVGTGYLVENGERWITVNDPWSAAGSQDYAIEVGKVTHTVRTSGPPNARSDEEGIVPDSDGDGIVDFDETERFGTSISNPDTDDDGVPDGKDVFASVHDAWHGYAHRGDGRDDIDGDNLPPERDDDADDGGCLDGLEDFNADGVFQRVGGETSPFEEPDDRCISGRFLLAMTSDSTTESQIHHTEVRHEVKVSLLEPMDDGTVEGAGTVDYLHYTHDITPGRCESFLGPYEVSWPVKITGRFTPDDVLSFEVDPPSRTIPMTVTGSCGSDSFDYEVSQFHGWADITFTDGVYEFVVDTPHSPPDTGSTHLELKLKQERETP